MRTQVIGIVLAIALVCPCASAQWVQTNGPSGNYVNALAVNGTILFAGTQGTGVFLSSNDGASWTPSGLSNRWVMHLATGGTTVFAATDSGVCVSTDNGKSWTQTRFTNSSVTALAVSGTNIFAGTSGMGILLSSNNGSTWIAANTGLTSTTVNSLVVSGANVFAGTWPTGVFVSTNNGSSWTATGFTRLDSSNIVKSLVVVGASLYAGTQGPGFWAVSGGVYRSTDNGVTWGTTGLKNMSVLSLAVSGSNIFAATYPEGVLISTNHGTSWTSVNDSLTASVRAFAVRGTNLFAGGAGVWKRPLSEMITSAQPTTSDLPQECVLHQNYPNPFNPTTTIRYALPHRSHVTLTVFNTLGQKVVDLVNGDIDAGYNSAEFNASNLASGVYFYRLQTGSYVETKKLVLTR